MKRILQSLAPLLFVLAVACGEDAMEETATTTEDATATVEVIDETTDSPFSIVETGLVRDTRGEAILLGAVTNDTSETRCFVRLDRVDFLDAVDALLGTEGGFVAGEVRKLSASQTNTCLLPGGTGEFAIFTDIPFEDVASVVVEMTWSDQAGRTPDTQLVVAESSTERVDPNIVQIRGTLTNEGEESAIGETTTLQFFIKNEAGEYFDWDFDTQIEPGTEIPAGATVDFRSLGARVGEGENFLVTEYLAWNDPEFVNGRLAPTAASSPLDPDGAKRAWLERWNARQAEAMARETSLPSRNSFPAPHP